jgi:hypothetical protein
MQQHKNNLRKWIAGAGAIGLLFGAGAATSATRSMVGALGVTNPSTSAPFYFEGGPNVFGKKMGVYPPTSGFKTIAVAGATGGTFAGRQVTLMANQMVFAKGRFRDFPAFPNVGQTTKTVMSANQAATFMVGGGALAGCPGPGCVNNGAGTFINFCPPNTNAPNPAPGTAAAKVGNWDCTAYNNAGANNRAKRFSIRNSPGAPHFGGVLGILRSQKQNVWRVNTQPTTVNANNAQVSRSWVTVMTEQWTPGRPNFQFNPHPGHNGPILFARLNGNGAVQQTFGCVNGVGTPGVPFAGIPNGGTKPFAPIVGPGNNCGTNPAANVPGQGWGFKMTTGTISGSDFFPFSTETTALGTPFNPNRIPLNFGQGFFYTRMGDDTVVGTVRNIVLLGGGIAVDPGSGNAFDRLTSLHMRLQVPEPTGAAGLLLGAGALIGLAWRRR